MCVYFFLLHPDSSTVAYLFGYARSLAGVCKVRDFFFAQPIVLAFRIPEVARIHVDEQFKVGRNYVVDVVKA